MNTATTTLPTTPEEDEQFQRMEEKQTSVLNTEPPLGLVVEHIARVCHEVNRAYCQSLGDNSQKAWKDAPDWQKNSARAGVSLHLKADVGPEASHVSWMEVKLREGWNYGPVKDETKKEHPCLVPFNELPKEQQAKDYIFRAIVHAMC